MGITEQHLVKPDLNHIWHPCTQMKDHESFPPLKVHSAKGSYIELTDGRQIIDAISSWWCKSLGHNHPRLKQALMTQIDKFEHVILANTTNDTIINCSQKLAALSPSLNKVFYTGDGASAIETAIKMSLHARQILKQPNKNKIIALENGYHGDTTGAMSVSDVKSFRQPYEAILFDTHFISPIPYVTGTEDPLWSDCSNHWKTIEAQLAPLIAQTSALILEPIVQGAGGIKIYSADFLKRLREWTQQHDIHLIADEIMTGIGRTGKMLACQHADIEPDFLCLSKGLTSGWVAFSAMLTRDDIYQLFYDDYSAGKSFLHSHTYSGNAIGASIALETLNIMEQDNICQRVQTLEKIMKGHMQSIADETGQLKNIRALGGIVAADLIDTTTDRCGYQIFQRATELGALLRPIGNTLYWLPPLNIDDATLDSLRDITQQALQYKTG